MESLQGHLLVASTQLLDPNFIRTVVLMVQHNDEGALGLILNRPSDTRVSQVWERVSDSPCHTGQHLGQVAGGMAGQQMARLTMDGNAIVSEETLMQGVGRVRDIRQGPDGYIYVAIDDRGGAPTAVVRLEPAN